MNRIVEEEFNLCFTLSSAMMVWRVFVAMMRLLMCSGEEGVEME